jgi:hypothetical protein
LQTLALLGVNQEISKYPVHIESREDYIDMFQLWLCPEPAAEYPDQTEW